MFILSDISQLIHEPIDNFSGVVIVLPDIPEKSFPLFYSKATIDVKGDWRSGACNGSECLVLQHNTQFLFEKNGAKWYLINFPATPKAVEESGVINPPNMYVGLFSLPAGSRVMRYHGAVLVGNSIYTNDYPPYPSVTVEENRATLDFTNPFTETGLLPSDKTLRLTVEIDTALGQIREVQREIVDRY